ncbi:hypothetical protein WI97_00205 [Burkholderia vietnamiensis]|jgi:hypothetical protein|nr:hypothetical protein WJ02_25530 [Burkholderia vietnamiensis]KVE70796.1 hypothetical protein WI97_00205 [Burkholderia vietnamiensis]
MAVPEPVLALVAEPSHRLDVRVWNEVALQRLPPFSVLTAAGPAGQIAFVRKGSTTRIRTPAAIVSVAYDPR